LTARAATLSWWPSPFPNPAIRSLRYECVGRSLYPHDARALRAAVTVQSEVARVGRHTHSQSRGNAKMVTRLTSPARCPRSVQDGSAPSSNSRELGSIHCACSAVSTVSIDTIVEVRSSFVPFGEILLARRREARDISGRRVVNSAPTLILDEKARRMINEMIAAEARQ
jgi:hypothetical protein